MNRSTFLLLFFITGCATSPSNGGEELGPALSKEETESPSSAMSNPAAIADSGSRVVSGDSERLLATPPRNWKLSYRLNNEKSRLSDFVPPAESDTNWTTKVSFESFRGLVDTDPITILLQEALRDEDKCSFVQHFNLFSGDENAYPTSVRLFMCGNNSFIDKGEVKLIKAIAGNEYFYMIKIIKRLASFEPNQPDVAKQEIAMWSAYVRDISVCDPNQAEHPCPPSPTTD